MMYVQKLLHHSLFASLAYRLERTDCMVVNKNKEEGEVKEQDATLQFFLHVTFPPAGSKSEDFILKQSETSLNDILASTILQKLQIELMSNEYDTIAYDGRERCNTPGCHSIRAEDGRYVHNTNVSAFLAI